MTKVITTGDAVVLCEGGTVYTVEAITIDGMSLLTRPVDKGIDFGPETLNGRMYLARRVTVLEHYTPPAKYKVGDMIPCPHNLDLECEIVTVKERTGKTPVYILSDWENLEAHVYTEQDIEEGI